MSRSAESKEDAKSAADSKASFDYKSESSTNESKRSTAGLIEKIQEFCMSSQLEKEFEEFAKSHASVFQKSIDLKDGDEHPLAFHDVYREYLEVFERRIENFALQVTKYQN